MTTWQEFKLALGLRRVWTDAEEAGMADATAGKSILASKTFWANLLGGLAMFAPQVQAVVPPQYYALGMGALNIVLRLLTKQPISGITVS